MERMYREGRCSRTFGRSESVLVVAGGAIALAWVLAVDGAGPTFGDLYRLLVVLVPGS